MKTILRKLLFLGIFIVLSVSSQAERYIAIMKTPEASSLSQKNSINASTSLKQLGVPIISAISATNGKVYTVVECSADDAERMKSIDSVQHIEKDQIAKAARTSCDYNDFTRWGLDRVKAEAAWDIATGNSDDVIAVLDSGIDISHQSLFPNIWVNPYETVINGRDDDNNGFIDDLAGWNFVSYNNNVYDDCGHGTHVAGIISATGNKGSGVIGVSFGTKVIPIKVLDQNGEGYVSGIIDGVIYATNLKRQGQANIIAINMSLGIGGDSVSLREAIKYAESYGITVVVAAGNADDGIYGSNNDIVPSFPANFAFDYDNVISVAALSENGQLADFSNYGRNTVTVAAPGDDIWSTVPYNPFTQLAFCSNAGTSMATPFVSGAVGLIKSVNPSLNPRTIKKIIANGEYNSSLINLVQGANELDLYRAVSNSSVASNIYKVRGAITCGGVPCKSISVFCEGCLRDYAITNAYGMYEFEVKEGAYVKIAPYSKDYRFEPGTREGDISVDKFADFEAYKSVYNVTFQLKRFVKKGRIFKQSKKVKNFIIALRSTDGVHDWIGKTNRNGIRTFRNVPEGQYKIGLYNPAKKTIKISGNKRVTINRNIRFKITLKPK